MIDLTERWPTLRGSAIILAMVTVGRIRGVIALGVTALLLTGCSGISLLPGHGHGHGASSAQAIGQDGPAADPADVAVVRKWASALRSGDIHAAAETFGLPSVFSNGETLEIHSLAQAEAIQASLPCGAEVISAFRQGKFINVLFRLVDRQGRGGGKGVCGTGVGSTARTEFLIRNGHIAEWLRAPSIPGDPGVPTTPKAPSPASPGTNTGPTV